MKINRITTNDERYLFFKGEKLFEFLSTDIGPVWVSNVPAVWKDTVSYDGVKY